MRGGARGAPAGGRGQTRAVPRLRAAAGHGRYPAAQTASLSRLVYNPILDLFSRNKI